MRTPSLMSKGAKPPGLTLKESLGLAFSGHEKSPEKGEDTFEANALERETRVAQSARHNPSNLFRPALADAFQPAAPSSVKMPAKNMTGLKRSRSDFGPLIWQSFKADEAQARVPRESADDLMRYPSEGSASGSMRNRFAAASEELKGLLQRVCPGGVIASGSVPGQLLASFSSDATGAKGSTGVTHFLAPSQQTAEMNAVVAPQNRHEALVQLFDIPYHFTVMSPEGGASQLPPMQLSSALKSAKSVALGDLHGSYHKLMETLVAADLVEMPLETAQQFVHLACDPRNFSMDAKALSVLDQQLQALIPQMRWKGGNRQLILMGDVLSDRGPLDTVTLALIQHFSQQAPQSIVRLASNHDHNVLVYLLDERSFMREEFIPSMIRACRVAQNNQQFGSLVNQYFAYISQSKLLHLDVEGKTLFAHAPITPVQLERLDSFLELVRGRDGAGANPSALPLRRAAEVSTVEELAYFVNKVNQLYREYVLMHQGVYNAFIQNQQNAEQLRERLGQFQQNLEPVLSAQDGLLWVRHGLDKRESLPFLKAGVKTLVHGHDIQSANSPFSLNAFGDRGGCDYVVANLDQNVRKGNYVPPNQDSLIFRLP